MELSQINNLIKNFNVHLCEKDKEALFKYASEVKDGGLIVDIGTAAGGSAFVMALASKPTVKVITIDPIINEEFMNNRRHLDLIRKILFLNQTSKEAFKNMISKEIDMLFIDGVHSYDGVMNDYNSFGKIVKKGGIIVFHDIFLYENTIGEAVKEIVKKDNLQILETIDDKWRDDRRIGMLVIRT